LTTVGIPLSQSVIVRCTTWPEPPDADPEADPDADVAPEADVDDEPELQAATARAMAVTAPAATAPRLERAFLTIFSPLKAIGIRAAAPPPGNGNALSVMRTIGTDRAVTKPVRQAVVA